MNSLNIFHFIKYYQGLNPDDILSKNISKAVICFDLEDSIQNVIHPQENKLLKASHRLIIADMMKYACDDPQKMIAGVRINACNTEEQEFDLKLLEGSSFFHALFVPKVESATELEELEHKLRDYSIEVRRIIPVIESCSGMENIKNISSINSQYIKEIAFGHCDYNLSAGIFPFIHQPDREYWNWIEVMNHELKKNGLLLLNSPFLELNNDEGFVEMLSRMNSVCEGSFGQITLSFRQSRRCSEYDLTAKTKFKKIPPKLDFTFKKNTAEEFLNLFGSEDCYNGFSVVRESRLVLSPQEFVAAKESLPKSLLPSFNFAFMGGCFPVQGNIPFDKLFHQLLKRNIESKSSLNFNLRIIRYESLFNCQEKVIDHLKNYKTDVLVFCIRSEPVLRFSKLIYRCMDKDGKSKLSINFARINLSDHQKVDVLQTDERFVSHSGSVENLKPDLLRNINYIAGLIIGNTRFAMEKYIKLIMEINKLCLDHDFRLIVMGPSIRANTLMERFISKRLHSFVSKKISRTGLAYIDSSDEYLNGESVFFPNRIHVNQKFHEIIASKLYREIMKEDKLA